MLEEHASFFRVDSRPLFPPPAAKMWDRTPRFQDFRLHRKPHVGSRGFWGFPQRFWSGSFPWRSLSSRFRYYPGFSLPVKGSFPAVSWKLLLVRRDPPPRRSPPPPPFSGKSCFCPTTFHSNLAMLSPPFLRVKPRARLSFREEIEGPPFLARRAISTEKAPLHPVEEISLTRFYSLSFLFVKKKIASPFPQDFFESRSFSPSDNSLMDVLRIR